jgi:ElaB/YqjD/DUF883 family membrane-anchored ribosome-binding protein
MKSSAQLEVETEEARARVNSTLEELRARATPGQLVDQLIDYARASDGGMFADNLRRQVVGNPLPVVLLGTSLAWIALGSTRAAVRSNGQSRTDFRHAVEGAMANTNARLDQATESASDVADNVRERSAETVDNVRERVSDAVDTLRENAGSTADNLRDRASEAYGRAANSGRRVASSVAETLTDTQRSVADFSRNFVALCKEQPILMASVGVALGATLGALLPTSDVENRLVGSASDDVKRRARHLGEQAKESAESVYDQAKDVAAHATEPQADALATATADLGHS